MKILRVSLDKVLILDTYTLLEIDCLVLLQQRRLFGAATAFYLRTLVFFLARSSC